MPTIATAEPLARTGGLVTVDGRAFPLRATRIWGRAEGGLAETTLTQEYSNPYAEPLEVLYTMPLPADGAVAGYSFRLGDRLVTGRIETLSTARETYRRALEEGRTAGLLEERRADTFVQTLGNLPPGAAVTAEIRVLHRLAFRAGIAGAAPIWEYRFPTVAGVRYQGEPGRVPDAADLDAPRSDAGGTPVRLDAELVVGDGAPAAIAPRSSSHDVTSAADESGTRIGLAESSRLDRDLVLTWSAATARTEARVIEGPGLAGDGGRYALLVVTPPAFPTATMPRDLSVLIDASGSMDGRPLEQAKRVVEALLRSLGPEDSFEVVEFANRPRPVAQGRGTPGEVAEALRRLVGVRAGGSTEMATAIDAALRPLRGDGQRQVVLLTDGYIGFEREVVGRIFRDLPPNSRLHAVGIGSAPNRTLMHGASRAGRGVELLVGLGDNPAEAAARLVRATEAPVLTDVTIGGSAVRAVAPQRPRDVLAGEPLLVFVELKGRGGTIEVSGRPADGGARWIQRFEAPPADAGAAHALPLGAFFGRESVEDVEARLAAGQGDADAIESLGLRHAIVTRRTSLVAVSEDPTVDPRDPRRREKLAVEMPDGVSAEGVGLGSAEFLSRRVGMAPDGLLSEMTMLRSSEMAPMTIGRSRRSLVEIVRSFLHRGEKGLPVSTERTVLGRVVRREGELLVVELEVPEGGLEFDEGAIPIVTVWRDAGRRQAVLVPEKSTKPGRHAAGLTVRIALKILDAVGDDDVPEGIALNSGFRPQLIIAVEDHVPGEFLG